MQELTSDIQTANDPSLMRYFSPLSYSEEHHKGKSAIPETRGVEDGSTKRNIQRKHSHDKHSKEKKQGGGGGGKGSWDPMQDGSMD